MLFLSVKNNSYNQAWVYFMCLLKEKAYLDMDDNRKFSVQLTENSFIIDAIIYLKKHTQKIYCAFRDIMTYITIVFDLYTLYVSRFHSALLNPDNFFPPSTYHKESI